MPSRRSRLEERERKKRYCENRTEVAKAKDQLKAKQGMQIHRLTRSEKEDDKEKEVNKEYKREIRSKKTDGELDLIREKSKAWKRNVRKLRTDEEIESENESKRKEMAETRRKKPKEIKEFEGIKTKHDMRIYRKQQTGKHHLTQNLKAKKGMRLLQKEGSLKEFSRRSGGKVEEIRDWEMYNRKGKSYSEYLRVKKPDIIQVLNEKIRLEKESERKRREKEKKGEWCYHGESGEYYWTGDGEPEYGDNFVNEGVSAEELKQFREEENKMFEEMLEERKQIQKEKRKQRQRERKEAMDTPVQPLPEKELCEYEKLRESNIKERQDAMAASNFFEDFNEYKNDIGLTKGKNLNEEGSKVKPMKAKGVKKKVKTLLTKGKTSPEKGSKGKSMKVKGLKKKIKTLVTKAKEVVIDKQAINDSDIPVSKDIEDPEKTEVDKEATVSIYENFQLEDYYLHDCL